jgi:hypothetical protein
MVVGGVGRCRSEARSTSYPEVLSEDAQPESVLVLQTRWS